MGRVALIRRMARIRRMALIRSVALIDPMAAILRAAALAIASATLAAGTACDPGTRRPTFLPQPQAVTTELELPVPAATQALAAAFVADSVPMPHVVPRDGYVESPWLDSRSLAATGRRALGPDVVKVRGWVEPSRHGYSLLTVEVVYRTSADPSSAARDLEAEVASSNPASMRVRRVLERLGGRPVDQPGAAPLPVQPVPSDTALIAKREAAERRERPPAPNPIPSPVSIDSGAIAKSQRSPRDSITSTAPGSAPTQGQRAAPPSAVVAATPTRTPPPATRTLPTQTPAPATTVPPTATHFSVQVAAVRSSAEATPILTRFIAAGFSARIDTESGWMKVRIGEYPTAAAAEAARVQIRSKVGGEAFVVRR